MTDDVLERIRHELARIGADTAGAGERDSIGANDEHDGWASLGASPLRHDFYWYGRAEDILERLAELPGRGGPAAIRDEFRSRYPGLEGV